MSLIFQVIFGGIFLGLCSLVHIVLLVWTVKYLKRLGRKFEQLGTGTHWGVVMSVAFAEVIIAHTTQVWIWAIAFVSLGALSNIDDAIYFSLVTYTTLGYGDVTVAIGFRTFAAMAAVTGLLNFGLSTAFLAGLVASLFREDETG